MLLPFTNIEKLILIPMPVIRRRQEIPIGGDLLDFGWTMRSLDFEHAVTFGRGDPFCASDAVVLDQLLVVCDLAAADVEVGGGGGGHREYAHLQVGAGVGPPVTKNARPWKMSSSHVAVAVVVIVQLLLMMKMTMMMMTKYRNGRDELVTCATSRPHRPRIGQFSSPGGY